MRPLTQKCPNKGPPDLRSRSIVGDAERPTDKSLANKLHVSEDRPVQVSNDFTARLKVTTKLQLTHHLQAFHNSSGPIALQRCGHSLLRPTTMNHSQMSSSAPRLCAALSVHMGASERSRSVRLGSFSPPAFVWNLRMRIEPRHMDEQCS
jgi:hypothetical protein